MGQKCVDVWVSRVCECVTKKKLRTKELLLLNIGRSPSFSCLTLEHTQQVQAVAPRKHVSTHPGGKKKGKSSNDSDDDDEAYGGDRGSISSSSVDPKTLSAAEGGVVASPYKGVSWKQGQQQWRAQIQIDGTMHYLGYFDTQVRPCFTYLFFAYYFVCVNVDVGDGGDSGRGAGTTTTDLWHTASISRFLLGPLIPLDLTLNSRTCLRLPFLLIQLLALPFSFASQEEAASKYDDYASSLGRPLNFPSPEMEGADDGSGSGPNKKARFVASKAVRAATAARAASEAAAALVASAAAAGAAAVAAGGGGSIGAAALAAVAVAAVVAEPTEAVAPHDDGATEV